ncbi:bifunctional biotin--[acetyl-CoA-carboxylase] ligase/biotin operon repressor BirA [Methylomonas montana]|uniref:bifunctional biotin--[acetyl-CoA-carboxylase] ligase/biotin operon repressor BirA n=1 Tax=Methylomonas montana TaxID=3058963 RepID=UPI0026598E4F|nr:bifunctional biotin--[acetyl-CoA-carboxylase] ligase/biotin operon repressor BirA [Methylomonas montana]WKJ89006.1 bifunctional biotin--[acetyl-CoA-carboxylase] ligase/biotin operon repressor BirA [Methylomonas montana]
MLISPKLKQLLSLLADGRFHSGTELAQTLGISRSAVWKQQQVLAELGIELSAVSGKGYRLPRPLQLLEKQKIDQHLEAQTRQLFKQLEIHDQIHSTNTHLLEQAQRGGESGLVCLAEQQTAGKGRRGRQWVSPFGHNVYLSILWRFQGGPAAIAGLSLAMGVAVVRALRGLGIAEVGLKWPNDIYWRQRKLAGILIEVSGESSGPCHAVMGLGLNIYMPEHQAQGIEQDWVDLHGILANAMHCQRNQIVAALLNQLLPVIAEFESRTLSGYIEEWRGYDCMQGKQVSIFMAEQAYHGTVLGIDEQGLLLLAQADGQVRAFASGEVSFRPS